VDSCIRFQERSKNMLMWTSRIVQKFFDSDSDSDSGATGMITGMHLHLFVKWHDMTAMVRYRYDSMVPS
jgi:hypothetical protein